MLIEACYSVATIHGAAKRAPADVEGCQPRLERLDADVALSAFHAADVGAMQVGGVAQVLLGEAARFTCCAQHRANAPTDR